MVEDNRDNWIAFTVSAMIYHCLTYFVFGMIATSVFHYKEIFNLPVISDYYKPYGSVAVLLGPFLQVVRGILFGLVLLPFRDFLRKEKLGWLWLWLLFLVFGIIGTPSASPASIEGVIYTKLPLWFHLIGLPEIAIQTLIFSVLIHRRLRSKEHPLPMAIRKLILALVSACISFMGYTVISIVFALLSGVRVDRASADARVLGQFAIPLVLIFVAALIERIGIFAKHVVLYIASVASLFLYQEIILGSGGWLYSSIAPILPVLISFLLNRKKRTTA